MSDAPLDNLVRRAVELTGAPPPEFLEPRSAALTPASPAAREDGFYIVGLIGGKEVGKSALVNALVGKAITRPIGHGEGTAGVIAYAHRDQVEALTELLDREVPGRFTIVPHDNASLRRQVLLDLPDIDSHWADHLEITRRMLRHMLYPLWIQSIEKYADRQPQDLLRKVAAGNSAENFLFCLNKVDQLTCSRTLPSSAAAPRGPAQESGATAAAEELREDFAGRLAKTLSLSSPPRVWLISAANPGQFELPKLASLLSQQRTEDDVARSLKVALRQRDHSVLRWLDGLGLPQRLARVQRLEEEAQELLAERLEPLVTSASARGPVDSATTAAVLDDVLAHRVRRWPLVNMLHPLLNPLVRLGTTLVRPSAPAAITAIPTSTDANSAAAAAIQAAFAQLQRLDPLAGELYRDGKPWESLAADRAANDLARALEGVSDRQRAVLRQSLAAGPFAAVLAPWRWLLTVGVLLWFPLVQPVADVWLNGNIGDVPRLLVKLLAVSPLLQSVSLVLIWLVALWAYLRWDGGQRVQRRLARWQRDTLDPTLSPAAAVIEWSAGVLHPLANHRQTIELLLADAETMRRGDSL